MMITLGEIFQSVMAGVSLLSNATFTTLVIMGCLGKLTWFYDLVKIPYSKNPSTRSICDSFLRLATLMGGIICEALAGRFTKYGIFGSIFAFVEMITLFAIFGQIIIMVKETREKEKQRNFEKRMQQEMESAKQEIVEGLARHAVEVEIECNPEEFFNLMDDPEKFKEWLKAHKLQLSEEDRRQMTPEEEEALIAMGFLPTREEAAEAKEKATLEENKEADGKK